MQSILLYTYRLGRWLVEYEMPEGEREGEPFNVFTVSGHDHIYEVVDGSYHCAVRCCLHK